MSDLLIFILIEIGLIVAVCAVKWWNRRHGISVTRDECDQRMVLAARFSAGSGVDPRTALRIVSSAEKDENGNPNLLAAWLNHDQDVSPETEGEKNGTDS